MRSQTRVVLELVEQTPLFEQVGLPVGSEYINVGSWLIAAEHCSRLEYENYLLGLGNDLTEALTRTDRTRFRLTWNKTVREVRPRTRATVDRALASIRIPPDCVKPVGRVAGWCLLSYCMECEYRDVIDINHFHSIWEVFRAGHFPCGVQRWSGNQVLMVY